MFGRFTIVARIFGRPLKTMFEWKKLDIFSGKNRACLPFPKESELLIKPLLKKQLFHTFPRHWGHERVDFTLVGLFSGVHNCSNFFRADPGSQGEERNTFYIFLFSFTLSYSSSSPSSSLLFLFLFLFLFPCLSVSPSLSFPFPFSFYTLNKKLKVEKGNAINMLNRAEPHSLQGTTSTTNIISSSKK